MAGHKCSLGLQYKIAMIRSFLVGGWLIFATSASSQAFFSTELIFGNHVPAFKELRLTDWSRPSLAASIGEEPTGREMTIYIWYPSTSDKAEQMSYGNYVDCSLPDKRRKNYEARRNLFVQALAQLSGDTSVMLPVLEQLLAAPTKAVGNGVLASGRFPIVFFPDRPFMQNIMCEYLASHGYIVVSPVLKGTFSDAGEYNLRGIETAVSDLQFALGYIRQNYRTNKSFAVMGLGFNATHLLAWQMRQQDIRAYISLEGGITTGFEEQLIERSPYYDLQRVNASMLIIYAPHPDVNPALTYKYKYADRIYQYYPQCSEFYFLNFGIWEREIKSIFPKANKGNTWKSFEVAAMSSKKFLDLTLKSQTSMMTSLTEPVPEVMDAKHERANLLPPPFEELYQLILEKGINAAERLYHERRKNDKQPYPFTSFYQVAQLLIQSKAFNDLLIWAQLYADSYPDSAIPYTVWGRSLLELGKRQVAAEQYKKALQLVDGDANLSISEREGYRAAIKERLEETIN